jgi:hypothetical protein
VEFDDIVIGSGLSAIGTVVGLPANRRVLVLCGPHTPITQYYEPTRAVPCAHLGFGGLGNFWHGVIPTGGCTRFEGTRPADIELLFNRFYPGVEVTSRLGRPFLFIPWRPIRPQAEWQRLTVERARSLTLKRQAALRLAIESDRVTVWTEEGQAKARRVWICAGALHTPQLLDRSLDRTVSRNTVSDHILCYVGQIDRDAHPEVVPPAVEWTRGGLWLEPRYNDAVTGLFTLRPARFDYKVLDCGIEQRAVFGLPTGSAVRKILRVASAGLVAEALYNRMGLFRNSRFQSVYAQIAVADAHWLRAGDSPLVIRTDVIRSIVDTVRGNAPWPHLLPSRRPEIFLPMIHLHHSVDADLVRACGVNGPNSALQVVDASVYEHLGPEHHSFKMMVSAFARARVLE